MRPCPAYGDFALAAGLELGPAERRLVQEEAARLDLEAFADPEGVGIVVSRHADLPDPERLRQAVALLRSLAPGQDLEMRYIVAAQGRPWRSLYRGTLQEFVRAVEA